MLRRQFVEMDYPSTLFTLLIGLFLDPLHHEISSCRCCETLYHMFNEYAHTTCRQLIIEALIEDGEILVMNTST